MSPYAGNRVAKEEHEHGSELTTSAATKKAKGKGKSNKHKKKKTATRKRINNIGLLESIMAMPVDIVCEVRKGILKTELMH